MVETKSTIEQLRIDRSQTQEQTATGKWLIFTGVLICLGAAWYGYQTTSELAEPDKKVSPSAPIVNLESTIETTSDALAATVHKPAQKASSTDKVLDASGHIVARRVATVSSRVTGKLEGLHIEEGQTVSRDQILAEVDDVQANLSYQRAIANLSAVKASYNELLIIKKHEEKRLSRQKKLNQSQLISEQLTEDSQMRINQIAAQIDNKLAHIKLNQNNVALAKYELEQHKIRAPFDGVVISKNAQVGELISAGNSGGSIRTGVGTIVDMSSLEIEVEVNESYINRVSAGQQVLARLDAYPDWKIPSEVIAVIPTADRQKASIKVRIKLLEIDHRILPDMGVRVSFMSDTNAQEFIAAN